MQNLPITPPHTTPPHTTADQTTLIEHSNENFCVMFIEWIYLMDGEHNSCHMVGLFVICFVWTFNSMTLKDANLDLKFIRNITH